MPPKNEAASIKLIATNKKAFHDYFISDKVEAGMVLSGTEVKSLRDAHCNLKDSFARLSSTGNLELWNFHISPYVQGNRFNPEATRTRRLLMHRKEIDKFASKAQEKGMTLVPLRVYFKEGRAKVELGLGKGKNVRDKREDIKERDTNREIRRAVKLNNR
jgi:SsrA-binding protein